MNSRRGTRGQDGFFMVEIVVAAALLLIIILGLLGAFDAVTRLAYGAQRHQQALAYGQSEIERLRTLDYRTQLGLTSLPAASASDGNPPSAPSKNPSDPNFYVSGTGLKIMTRYSDKTSGLQAGISPNPEPLVGPGDPKLTSPQVVAGPESFNAEGVKGKIYRYVTFNAQHCPGLTLSGIVTPCLSDAATKRVTLALILDPVGNGAGPAKPIWISTVIADPLATPAGISPPTVPTGVSVTAQPLYLYDTPCAPFTTRQPITGSHSSHNTSALITKGCSGSGTLLDPIVAPPDLMDNDVTPGADTAPFRDYSNEVTRPAPGGMTSPAGLALRRPGSGTCLAPPASTSTDASRVHSWGSKAVPSTGFSIPASGRAGLSFWTQTLSGSAGSARMCVLLRSLLPGGLIGTTIGSGSYEQSQWPTSPTQLSFAWDLPASITTLLSGQRLVLTVWLTSSSASDVVLLYDHPSYQSSLTVTTTTPLP
ncbi:MAG: hypothetical protein WKF72_09900 [Nocardioidaceae bacterium]